MLITRDGTKLVFRQLFDVDEGGKEIFANGYNILISQDGYNTTSMYYDPLLKGVVGEEGVVRFLGPSDFSAYSVYGASASSSVSNNTNVRWIRGCGGNIYGG